MTDSQQSPRKFFTVTIDAATGQVVKLETFEASGAAHELSDTEKASLAQATGSAGLEGVLEQAFEAGIDCVLGGEDGQPGEESAEEAELRHELLAPLMKHSRAKRLLERGVLNRAIVGTLISHSMQAAEAAPGPGPRSGAESQGTVEPRAN